MLPVQAAVTGALAQVLQRGPLSDGKITFAWRAGVGAAVARAASVQLGQSGVLTVNVTDERWAREIRRSAGVILTRLETLLGRDVIRELSVHVRRQP